MFLIAFEFVLLSIQAQASCAPVDALKAKVYTFRPSTLSSDARAAKSKEMDQFWELVKAQKDGTACLRELLIREKEASFFLYDGASLLAELDRTDAARQVILQSIVRAPLADVNGGAYVALAIELARDGADISTLAERFLEHPAETLSAPAHAMSVNRIFGALLLFGILPVERADAALTRALESSQPRVRESAAVLMAMLMSEGGFKVLSQSPRVGELPATTRTQIDQVRRATGFKPPAGVPAFTRAEVLDHLRRLPRTAADYAAAQEREDKYRLQLPASAPIGDVFRHMQDGPPFTSLADHSRFIESAAATLTAEDLPALREWRSQSVRSFSDETLGDFMAFSRIVASVIARLNLYAEYRR